MATVSGVPSHQTVARVVNPGPDARFVIQHQQPMPVVLPSQILVKLEVAGLCHSDLNRVYGALPLISDIVGHEGVGVVVQAGSPPLSHLLSTRVGVGWLSKACLKCAVCQVEYTSCPMQNNLGRDLLGTFQRRSSLPTEAMQAYICIGESKLILMHTEYIAVDAAFAHPIPDDLASDIAAPLLCAGISMFSAIRKTNLTPQGWLLLPGAGGGLGHLGVQIAAAQGFKVMAVDTGEEKRASCLANGAAVFLDYKAQDVAEEVKQLTGWGVDAIICIAGSLAAYKQAVQCVRNAGTIICIGVTSETIPISPLDMVRRGLRIIGSAVGTRVEMQELFQLAAQGHVKPQLHPSPVSEIDVVARKLKRGQINGRIVLSIPQ